MRAVALELERLANHSGDLGALAGDVGFLPTLSYCGRLRGDFLNMTALLCGNRFGRGLVRPGGVGLRPRAARAPSGCATRLDGGVPRRARRGGPAVGTRPSVMARFEGTGRCRAAEVAWSWGWWAPRRGPAASTATCAPRLPVGHLPLRPDAGLHVAHRRRVRPRLRALAGDPALARVHPRPAARRCPRGRSGPSAARRRPDSLAVSLVEGWRGEICHVAITDAAGRFAPYKVVDPSFHNWIGLALALREQQISDFPLCNKSFNLSYCGHDL